MFNIYHQKWRKQDVNLQLYYVENSQCLIKQNLHVLKTKKVSDCNECDNTDNADTRAY